MNWVKESESRQSQSPPLFSTLAYASDSNSFNLQLTESSALPSVCCSCIKRRFTQVLLLQKEGPLLIKITALWTQKHFNSLEISRRAQFQGNISVFILVLPQERYIVGWILNVFTSWLSRIAASVNACRSLSKVLFWRVSSAQDIWRRSHSSKK